MSEPDVRGGATAEEVAAVLAVLAARLAVRAPGAYAQWRSTRLAVLDMPNRDG